MMLKIYYEILLLQFIMISLDVKNFSTLLKCPPTPTPLQHKNSRIKTLLDYGNSRPLTSFGLVYSGPPVKMILQPAIGIYIFFL